MNRQRQLQRAADDRAQAGEAYSNYLREFGDKNQAAAGGLGG